MSREARARVREIVARHFQADANTLTDYYRGFVNGVEAALPEHDTEEEMSKIETPATMTAVWLVRTDNNSAEVRVEIGGRWYVAIRERLDNPFSHIAEGNGRGSWPEWTR